MKPKTTTESKTMLAVLLTAIAGIAGSISKPIGDFLSANAPHIIVLLAFLFGFLRKITNKPLIWLPVLAVCFLSLNSCTVSFGANGRPQVGVDPYSAKQVIREITNKVNAKIVDYSK